MRYSETPRFPTRHWARLWKANIPDIQGLKDHNSESVIFVAVDAEPWSRNTSEPAEIGITILAPLQNMEFQTTPNSLEALREHFTLRALCFRVSGREHTLRKKRENKYWGEQLKVIGSTDIEDTIVKVLESIPPSFISSSQKPRLCLVGFDLNFEIRFLSSLYPRILHCFSLWVGLQELIVQSNDLNFTPNLGETLLSLGFERKYPIWRSPWVAHNAGNDSVRILFVLLSLLSHDPNSTLDNTHERTSRAKRLGPTRHFHKLMKDGRFFKNRPKPYESYPFAARLSLENNNGPRVSVKQLYDTFKDIYDLAAVAMRHDWTKPPYDRGWACLASLDELNRFVAELNGSRCDNGVWEGTWRVESFYDPTVTPATTAEELEKWLDERSVAHKEQKVTSRKRKENIDPITAFEGSWVIDEEYFATVDE